MLVYIYISALYKILKTTNIFFLPYMYTSVHKYYMRLFIENEINLRKYYGFIKIFMIIKSFETVGYKESMYVYVYSTL